MGKNVVVVDDEEDLCQILEIALRIRNMDIKVHKAHDGVAGLELIRKIHPDLAILDVKMPRATGYEVVQSMRSDDDLKSIPVMMLTSLTTGTHKSDEEWRESIGVQAFLTKPYDTEKLLRQVEDMLGIGKPV